MKQFFFGFLVLCVGDLTGQWLQISTAQSSSKSPGGLVAAWNFDETKGDQAKDSSRRGHHGILRGATRAAGV